jgi:transposase InsO family protein
MAVTSRNRSGSTILHADHGKQFTSWKLRGEIAPMECLLGLFGTVGDCFDNAAMGPFWALMQVELLNTRRWATTIELAARHGRLHRQRLQDRTLPQLPRLNISSREFQTLWTSSHSNPQLA